MQNGADGRVVVWLDIDNTLYPHSSKIAQAMGERIHAYFMTLGLSYEEAHKLHMKYYAQYGLALRGLIQHHQVDPLDFDRKCDGSLPLEQMLQPNPSIRKLFLDIDRSKARVWGLTNAYITHARRVVRILDLEDQIDDIVYCDYQQPNFPCKPDTTYYRNALDVAGVLDPSKCYFVDDNRNNVNAAKALGWGRCVHYYEYGSNPVDHQKGGEVGGDGIVTIHDLEELRQVWPEIFKKQN